MKMIPLLDLKPQDLFRFSYEEYSVYRFYDVQTDTQGNVTNVRILRIGFYDSYSKEWNLAIAESLLLAVDEERITKGCKQRLTDRMSPLENCNPYIDVIPMKLSFAPID